MSLARHIENGSFESHSPTIHKNIGSTHGHIRAVPAGSPRAVTIHRASRSVYKRRVQIPLPRCTSAVMDRLQGRFGLPSNAAVIQVAVGLLFHLFEIQQRGGAIEVENSNGNRRPIHPLTFLGTNSFEGTGDEGVIKYQISVDPEQDHIVRGIGEIIGASSVAETVRLAIRILDSVGRCVLNDEHLLATFSDGEEMVMTLK
jgi:hypothetical protein